MEEWKGHLNPPKFDAPAQFARFLSLMHLCRAQSHVCALHQQPTIYLAQFCSEAKDHSALIVRTGALHVMMTCYTLAAMFFRLWPFMPIYMDFLFYWQWYCHWLMLFDSDLCWLTLIGVGWCWLILIYGELCRLMLMLVHHIVGDCTYYFVFHEKMCNNLNIILTWAWFHTA